MKRSLFFILAFCILAGNTLNGQGGLLKKVTKSMTNELLGKPQEVDRGPEPASACSDAKLLADLGGKLQIDYTEVSISVRDDGAILMKYRMTGEYYIAKDGVTQGPYKAGDKRLAGFEIDDDSFNPTSEEGDEKKDAWLTKYPQYISKKGDKYLINFGGKTYGPYSLITSFALPRSKDKFAALVIENIVVTESQGDKMEKAMENAKSDEERMELAMKYSQEVSKKMMEGGGPQSMMSKLVTNIPGINYDPAKSLGGVLSGTLKYDEILLSAPGKIIDLNGTELIKLSPGSYATEDFWVNTGNTKYASYNYGALTFSDGKTLPDLFAPALAKIDGKVYLTYMYYSPKKNAIMQCKIDF